MNNIPEKPSDVKLLFTSSANINALIEQIKAADYVVVAEATTEASITTPPRALFGACKVGDGSVTAAEYRHELKCEINAKPRLRALHLRTPCGIDATVDFDMCTGEETASLLAAAMSKALVIADATAFLGFAVHIVEPKNVMDLGLLVRCVFPAILFNINEAALKVSDGGSPEAKERLVKLVTSGKSSKATLESICHALGSIDPQFGDKQPPNREWPSGREWQLKILSDDDTTKRIGAVSHAAALHSRACATEYAFQQLFSVGTLSEIHDKLRTTQAGTEFLDVFSEAILQLAKMHKKGIAVNTELLDEIEIKEREFIKETVLELLEHVPQLSPMAATLQEPTSHATADVRVILGDYAKGRGVVLPVDENGAPKVGAKVLALAGAAELPGLAAWTRLEASKRRFNVAVDLRKLSKDGADNLRRTHPSLSLKTISLRASCKVPNAQAFDASTKSAIIAAPGHVLIEADFGAIEIRIAAAGAAKLLLDRRPAGWRLAGMYDVAKASGMPLVQLLKEGLCPHNFTALQLLKQPDLQSVKSRMEFMRATPTAELRRLVDGVRQAAKTVNFGLLYGMSALGLWKKGVIDGVQWTLEDAQEARAAWFAQFPEIDYACAFVKEAHRASTATKMLVKDRYSGKVAAKDVAVYKSETLGGRAVASLDNQIVNLRAQSTGATLLFKAIVISNRRIKDSMIMCVHDSILIEAPEAMADVYSVELSEAMHKVGEECLGPYGIPTVVDISRVQAWSEMK